MSEHWSTPRGCNPDCPACKRCDSCADLEARLAECEMHLAKVLPAAQSYRRLKLGFDTDEIFEAKNYLAKYPKEQAHD